MPVATVTYSGKSSHLTVVPAMLRLPAVLRRLQVGPSDTSRAPPGPGTPTHHPGDRFFAVLSACLEYQEFDPPQKYLLRDRIFFMLWYVTPPTAWVRWWERGGDVAPNISCHSREQHLKNLTQRNLNTFGRVALDRVALCRPYLPTRGWGSAHLPEPPNSGFHWCPRKLRPPRRLELL